MSLPLTHAGLSAPGISAALDLKFASTLSLTSSSGITPSFSRASSGTYFGSDGLLKYANVNTILYSEDFTNAYWTKSGISVSGNSTVAPDGKTTADKIVENSAGGIKYGTVSGGFSVTSGTTYCFSVYLKDSGRYLGFATNSTAFPNPIGAVFNPANGTISNIQPNTTASIQDVGNGWYRCSISGTANASATTNINFGVSNDLNQIYPSYTGNGSSGYFLWGFQMETGSTPGTYVPTTNAANSAPRFDFTYNGTSWISRGLLVEEQRTNTVLQSQDFGTTWQLFNTTRSTNVIASPDGTQNADSMTGSAGTAIKGVYQQGLSFSSATATFSVFAKKGTHDKLQICYGGTDSTNYANFDLTNGVVGSFTGSASIVNVGNGWYRCVHSVTGLNATDLYLLMVDSLSSGRASTATTTGTVYLWQAQGELGAFATSAIPTTSASATRSSDVCQITGTDFSGFWNASEGSVAVEFSRPIDGSASGDSMIYIFPDSSDPANSQIGAYITSGKNTAYGYASSAFQYNFDHGTQLANTTYKIATGIKVNDFASSQNGGAVLTDTSGSVPSSISRLLIGYLSWSTGARLNGHIARLRYFNKRLTDKQLEDLCRPEDQLKLDLKFSENLSLTPVVGPTPSFSRASTGTYFNSSGVLTSAAINAPRFDYAYDGTSWISKGLLIEEQRANLALQSNSFQTTWGENSGTMGISQNAIGPDGLNNSAWTFTDNQTGNLNGRYQSISLNSGTTYTASVFIKKTSGTQTIFPAIYAARVGAGMAGRSINTTSAVTYAVSLVGYTTISTTATVIDCGGFWKLSSTFTANATGLWDFVLVPAATGVDGVLNLALTGSAVFYGAQLESGAFLTSYIPTTTTSVVRSADVCQITGTAFSGMWNATEGSAAIEWDSINGSSGDNYILTAYQSGLYSTINFYASSTNAEMYTYSLGYQARFLTAKPSALTVMKMAYGYRANDFAGSFNGAAVLTDTSGSVAGATSLQIGQYDGTGTYLLNGHISRIRYYAIRLPNRLLIAKSQ